MLFNPAQFSGKVNNPVALLDFGLLLTVERLTQPLAFIRRESPRLFNYSVHICGCHNHRTLFSERLYRPKSDYIILYPSVYRNELFL